MIVGSDFIWLHFPKAAGTSIELAMRELFKGRDDVVFDPTHQGAPVIWHHTIQERIEYDPSFKVGNRRIICGTRRLPPWVISRGLFESKRPPYRTPCRNMVLEGLFYEPDGRRWRADDYLVYYFSHPIDHWVRTEYAADDLAHALNLPPASVAEVLPNHNVNEDLASRETSFWFTKKELKQLYHSCPVWAHLEEHIYGSLISV